MRDKLRHGDRIPGSRLFRAFCEGCGEPMRVADPDSHPDCEECSGSKNHRSKTQGMMLGRKLIYLPEHRKE